MAAVVRPETRAQQPAIESAIATANAADVDAAMNRRFAEMMLADSAEATDGDDGAGAGAANGERITAVESSFEERTGMTPVEVLREASRRARAAAPLGDSATLLQHVKDDPAIAPEGGRPKDSTDEVAALCTALIDRRVQATAGRVLAAAGHRDVAVVVEPAIGTSARAALAAPADANPPVSHSFLPDPQSVLQGFKAIPVKAAADLGFGLTAQIEIGPEMVLVAENDDQLACLIAHELAHIHLGHPDSSWWIGKGRSLVGMGGDVAVGTIPLAGPLLSALLPTKQIVGDALVSAPLRVAGHDREQEFAADRTGQEFVARAGFAPAACADLLLAAARHAQAEGGDAGDTSGAWTSAHPPSVERILALREGAGESQ
jgi:hypothetical protein